MTQSLTYVEVDVDFCSLAYAVSPCKAQFGYADGVNIGPTTIAFDGTGTEYLVLGGGLTGAADSKLFTLSLWFRLDALPSTGGVAFVLAEAETTAGGNTFQWKLDVNTSNKLEITAKNSAGTVILLGASTAAATLDNDIHHLLIAIDMSSTSKRLVYVDDVLLGMTWTTYTNDIIDFTAGDWSIAGAADGSSSFNGELADVWVLPATYIDFTVSGNRRLFIDANKRPVYLGTNGQVPTGSEPLLFLSGGSDTWQDNLGSGGGMTLFGSLSVGVVMGAAKCYNSRGTCQSLSTFTNAPVTLRFAMPTDYLPTSIDCIPSLDGVSFTPAVISLGADLGQRASLVATFTDHRWSDTGPGYDPYLSTRTYNAFKQGTYWAKFRARQPYLQGRPMRLITGYVGQALTDMETRNYIIDSFTGPTPDGKYTITAKDVLKLADGDSALAPVLSDGYLTANMATGDTSFTISPSGVGAEYPVSGYMAIGGSEVCSFSHGSGIDANALLLMHFGGTNGGTTFTDTSSFARTGTAVGNAQLSNTHSPFGLLSGKFDGNGDYVTYPDSNDWTFSGDLTFDFWAYPAALSSTMTLFCHQTDANNQYRMKVDATGTLTFEVLSAGVVIFTLSSYAGVISAAEWNYIALVRKGSTWTMYVSGAAVAKVNAVVVIPNYTSTFRVGNDATGTTGGFNGWIAEFRVSRVARIVANVVPSVGYAAASDLFTIVRGQLGTVTATHSAQDKVQYCIDYSAQDPASIIFDLFTTYTALDPDTIDLGAWLSETQTYLRTLYTSVLAQPTSINTLVAELIQQAALAVWWDDLNQQLRLQVLRAIPTTAALFTPDNYLVGSFSSAEQPDKRVSQVWTHYAQRNPLAQLTDPANYLSQVATINAEAEENYGVSAILEIFSRWIPAFGRSAALRLNDIQLGRFSIPPRQLGFSILRYGDQDAQLGGGYQLEGWTLQDATGAVVPVPIQVTQLTPNADRLDVLAEEMNFLSLDASDLTSPTIIVDTNTLDFNLRTTYDNIYPSPTPGTTVKCIINAGVIVGASTTSGPAFTVGTWPSGVALHIIVIGRIEGAGGKGGKGWTGSGLTGSPGGPALYTRQAINLDVSATTAQVWSGGGGGGGNENDTGAAGGGGGGSVPGAGGVSSASSSENGKPGTTELGGAGGSLGGTVYGGAGGNPGSAGGTAIGTPSSGDFPGGAAGAAIDGVSLVTKVGTGSILGSQIN